MHCPECGTAVPDSATFCPECGCPLRTPSQTEQTKASDRPARPDQPQPETPQQQPQASGTKGAGWADSKVGRTVILVSGIALLVVGILRVLMGFGIIGGSGQAGQTTPPVQTSDPSPAPAPDPEPVPDPAPEPTPAPRQGGVDDALVTNSSGFLTLYGCVELDGEQVSEVFEKYDYDQISDEGVSYFSPDNSAYGLFVRVGPDEKCAGFTAVDSLGVGGGTTPVWFNVVTTEYKTVDDALKNLGNVTFDQYEKGSSGIDVGVVSNAQGARFVFAGYASSEKTIALQLYNEAALSAGVLSNHGTNVDDVYASLVKLANDSTAAQSDDKIM